VVDLLRFLLLGEPDGDPYLLDGDTVFVPPRALTVEIDGAVRRPGRYELVQSKDVPELVALAGGLAPEAAHGLPWRVTSRGVGDGMAVRSVAADAKIDLHDGDVVRVPAVDDLRRTVVVEGAIVGPPGVAEAQRAPGIIDLRADATQNTPRDVSVTLPFVDGDGVRDLITKARGLQPWADTRGAYLLRVQDDGARKRIGVNLATVLSGKSEEVPVQAGDTLMVPSRTESVMVGGAVQRPGLYQYRADLKPTDYLALAGGATRNGNSHDARLLARAGGSVSLERASAVEPGDIITVPERRFTAADWVTISLVLGNLAVGVAALAITATR
jgi:protein involved in polysaccharide export with SLBB domain